MKVLIAFLIVVFVLAGVMPASVAQRRWVLLGCSFVVAVSFYSARVVL